MSDDKPRPPHRDYGLRKTPPRGLAIEATTEDRGDPTPPPQPGSVSNEDLAVQVRDVDKRHRGDIAVVTQRLSIVEARVERVPAIESKVDKLLLISAEKNQQQEAFSLDVTRAHLEVGKQQQLSEVEIAKAKEIAAVNDAAEAKKQKRERITLLIKGVAGGGVILELIHRLFL